jgi:hypothetical protein
MIFCVNKKKEAYSLIICFSLTTIPTGNPDIFIPKNALFLDLERMLDFEKV